MFAQLVLVEATLPRRGAPDVDGRVLGYPTPEVDRLLLCRAADAWPLPVLRLVRLVDVLAAGSVVPWPVGTVLLKLSRLVLLLMLRVTVMLIAESLVATLV